MGHAFAPHLMVCGSGFMASWLKPIIEEDQMKKE